MEMTVLQQTPKWLQ